MVDIDMLQKLYANVLDTAVDGIIIIDSRGHIKSINKSGLKIFEYDLDEILGKNVSILMNDHDKKHHDGYLHNYHTTRTPKIIGIGRDVIGKKKSGTSFYLRLAVSEAMIDGDVLFTGIIHDLTEVMESQAALKKLNEEAEDKVRERTYEVENAVNKLLILNKNLKKEIVEKNEIESKLLDTKIMLENALKAEKEVNELKTRFITTASHEFRTPLTSILTSISLIEKYASDIDLTKRQIHLEKVKKAVNHLTSLLSDFLSLSIIEEGRISINLAKCNLKSIVSEIIDQLQSICKPGQTLIYDDQFQNFNFTSDPKILKNIVFNLVSNAIKYSDLPITIRPRIAHDMLSIAIIDQGIGIPMKDQKNLFSRFFRAENVGNIQGTGLGLNIVKKYSEMLDIRIHFESIENMGTTFYLELNIK